MPTRRPISRRDFVYQAGLTGLGISLANPKLFSSNVKNKKDKLGIALVGLGGYAGNQLAPALLETEHCYLAGIVTGTPSKIPIWQSKYKIPDANVYNYENFDTIKDNKDIDIVYVVLPNSMHAEFTIRAAKSGKHVICEKPMALTVEDCDKMIKACKDAGVQLGIGYRLHYDPFNLEMARLGSQKVYGDLKQINAGFAFTIGDPNQWRLKKALSGGGPMQDIGIYCIQGICYTSGMEPIAVRAIEGKKTNPAKFSEVEESLSWEFEMPHGLTAKGICSYSENYNFLRAEAQHGSFELAPAYNYGGLQGKTPDGPMKFPRINQQARQMDAMSQAIIKGEKIITPGEMGRRDVRLINAVYEAMHTGKRVSLV